jgi:hypothetical protein
MDPSKQAKAKLLDETIGIGSRLCRGKNSAQVPNVDLYLVMKGSI